MKPKLIPAPERLRAHVHAIVRVDTDAGPDVPLELKVTVTKVVADPAFAAAEAERLNAVNGHKGCRYFHQITRFENPPVEVTPVAPMPLPEPVGSDSDVSAPRG